MGLNWVVGRELPDRCGVSDSAWPEAALLLAPLVLCFAMILAETENGDGVQVTTPSSG